MSALEVPMNPGTELFTVMSDQKNKSLSLEAKTVRRVHEAGIKTLIYLTPWSAIAGHNINRYKHIPFEIKSDYMQYI